MNWWAVSLILLIIFVVAGAVAYSAYYIWKHRGDSVSRAMKSENAEADGNADVAVRSRAKTL
jgi:flagellar basal body-associated protein FliL